MKTDLLADRQIGIQETDLPVMLKRIGVSSLDELIDKVIPENIRLKEPLSLAEPMTEREFTEHIAQLAAQNKLYTSYIGLGWYDTITQPLFSAMYSRIRLGTPLIPLIRQKSHKVVWKHYLISRLWYQI